MKPSIGIIILLGFSAVIASPSMADAGTELYSEIVFFVTWYDVGKTALEELEGILEVTNGFHKGKEINTVQYNAAKVTPDKMIIALKNAGTYIGRANIMDK